MLATEVDEVRLCRDLFLLALEGLMLADCIKRWRPLALRLSRSELFALAGEASLVEELDEGRAGVSI